MSEAKVYSMCKTRMQSAPEKEFAAVGIAGQIFNAKTKKFVTYFTSIPEGYLESMDVQVCDEARSFEFIQAQAMKTAEEMATEGAKVSTFCLEGIGWKKVMEVVVADIDESFALSEQTRERMKTKAKLRFGNVLRGCLLVT